MKNLTLLSLLVSFVSLVASADEGCPNLTGKFIRGFCRPDYKIDYTIEITQEVRANGVTVYHLEESQIDCFENQKLVTEEKRIVTDGVVHDGKSPVIPGGTFRRFCRDGMVVVEENGLGVKLESIYSLDNDGNLVLGNLSFSGERKSHTYKRMKE